MKTGWFACEFTENAIKFNVVDGGKAVIGSSTLMTGIQTVDSFGNVFIFDNKLQRFCKGSVPQLTQCDDDEMWSCENWL